MEESRWMKLTTIISMRVVNSDVGGLHCAGLCLRCAIAMSVAVRREDRLQAKLWGIEDPSATLLS